MCQASTPTAAVWILRASTSPVRSGTCLIDHRQVICWGREECTQKNTKTRHILSWRKHPEHVYQGISSRRVCVRLSIGSQGIFIWAVNIFTGLQIGILLFRTSRTGMSPTDACVTMMAMKPSASPRRKSICTTWWNTLTSAMVPSARRQRI